ncbi:MAG TPA: hypothetical protein PKG52_07395 [bacterium]|nr:hypothetical protein [bacterium]HPS30505.1 hypothetical protein [bacterium]
MRKRWIVIILFTIGIICYISAFSLFFDYSKVKSEIEKSPAGSVIDEILKAIKNETHSQSGCKGSDIEIEAKTASGNMKIDSVKGEN